SITDGEYRRAAFHIDFLTGLDGIEFVRRTWSGDQMHFQRAPGQPLEEQAQSMMVVSGKVRWSRPIMRDAFEFLKSVTAQTPKLCIPSPTYLHLRAGRACISEEIYPDLEEFWTDVVGAVRREIDDLYAAGCRYLQIDEVCFAMLCDPHVRDE